MCLSFHHFDLTWGSYGLASGSTMTSLNQEGLQRTFIRHPNRSILLGYVERLISTWRTSLIVLNLLVGHWGSLCIILIEWMGIILLGCVWVGVVDNGIQLVYIGLGLSLNMVVFNHPIINSVFIVVSPPWTLFIVAWSEELWSAWSCLKIRYHFLIV